MSEHTLHFTDSEIGLLRLCLHKGHRHLTDEVRDEIRVVEAKIAIALGSQYGMAEPDAIVAPQIGGLVDGNA